MTSILSKDDAEHVLKNVLDSFSDDEKSNLVHNLTTGKRLMCGSMASVFSDVDAGDMVTLSMTRTLPAHKLDYPLKSMIDQKSWAKYEEIIKVHTLRYYFATQALDESSFRNLILTHLGQAQ